MNKTAIRIGDSIRNIAYKPNEIISGIVVAGSVDLTEYTMSVQPADDGAPIAGVNLNAITGSSDGVILVPADGSNVVVGCVDGPGEWVLLRASELVKVIVTIGAVTLNMDGSTIQLQNSDVVLQMTDSLFKLNTPGESFYNLLKDLINYIAALTVPTAAGTSGVPVNVASFNALLPRLDHLLTA